MLCVPNVIGVFIVLSHRVLRDASEEVVAHKMCLSSAPRTLLYFTVFAHFVHL